MNGVAAAMLLLAPILEVDVDPAIDDAAQVRDWIVAEGNGVLEERGVEAEHAWRIAVAIGGATYDYQVALTLERDGAALADQPEPFGCECNNEQLLAKIEAAIGSAVDTLEREPVAAAPPPLAGEPPPDPPPNDLAPERSLGAMGGVGIAALIVGVGGVAGGIPLAVKADGVRVSEGEIQRQSTKPAGIALASVGGALIVTGAILLAVDVVRRKQTRTSLVPWISPRGVALALSGRF